MKIIKIKYNNHDFEIKLSKDELDNIRKDLNKNNNLCDDSKVLLGIGVLE